MLRAMTRSRILTGLAVALCSVAAGCGGDDSGGGASEDAPAISKADFIKQANAICTAGNKEIATAAQELGNNPSDDDIESFATDTLVPNIRGQVEDIRALGFPEADADRLDGLFTKTEGILDDVEDDPASINSPDDPFQAVNGEVSDYGLTACGS
jgi:hypothetical protein